MQADLDRRLSDLMRRAQDGDRQAYEALLTEAAILVRRFLRRHLRQLDHLEDLVQDTLLSIHRYRHTYDPARPPRPWILAIARHRLIDFTRRQKRRNENEVLSDGDVGEMHPAPVEDRGLSRSLRHALTLLSRTQREIIQMLKLDGYSVAEISEKTGLSQSSVKVTAHRGYKNLRKLIVGTAREQ